jgi:hypothetical protein
MTANQEDQGPSEDPLSTRLEAYFLQNIVPKLGKAARDEAIAAVGDYVAEAERTRIRLHEEVNRQLARVDEQVANLDRKAGALESVPAELRAVLEEGRHELSRRLLEAESNAQRVRADLLSKQEFDLRGLEQRRNELARAALELVEAGGALKGGYADFATSALALFKAEVDKLMDAADAAADAAVAAGGVDEERLLAKLEKRVAAIRHPAEDEEDGTPAKASKPRRWKLLPATRRDWIASGLYLAFAALFVYFVIWVVGRWADPAAERREEPTRSATAATTEVAPAAVAAGWDAFAERHEAAVPRCDQIACATFDEAWRGEDRTPQASAMRRRLFVLVLSDFSQRAGCLVEPPANLSERGDWTAAARFANQVILCLEGGATPLALPPRLDQVERLTRLLLGRSAPPASRQL